MQQAAFDALGIEARYELWETPLERLRERVAGMRAPESLGANVTIPHKTAVMPLLDAVALEALRVGAVNTIVREARANGSARLIGHNTDFTALRRVLREQDAWAETAGRRHILVLGAGGAALAALTVARLEGADVSVAARRVEAARSVLESLWRRTSVGDAAREGQESGTTESGTTESAIFGAPEDWLARAVPLDGDSPRLRDALAETTVLVNATPIGTRDPLASPLTECLLEQLPEGVFVFDMVYNPPETALVRAARARGLRASGGLAMLLYQGAEAFTLWTGQPAPLDAMRAALERAV